MDQIAGKRWSSSSILLSGHLGSEIRYLPIFKGGWSCGNCPSRSLFQSIHSCFGNFGSRKGRLTHVQRGMVVLELPVFGFVFNSSSVILLGHFGTQNMRLCGFACLGFRAHPFGNSGSRNGRLNFFKERWCI